ncbi:MAG: DUF4097 family beta strand repeat protein [Lachnospiraceae bacterium]|nr:DUF4097 family beta strand repeat protein [Lachnospiraceae bacterium]
MTTGMKKFTKGCLYTALVIFIIGAVLCSVGGLLGGFRQLDNMDIGKITGIPLIYRIGPNGHFEYGFRFWDSNDIDWGKYESWQRVNDNEGTRALNLTADTLRNLYIEAGACELHIEESEDEYVWLAVGDDANTLRYHIEDGDLRIVRKSNWTMHWVGINIIDTTDEVYLYLPKGTSLDYMDIEFGAGKMDSIELTAHDANIEVGAGELDIDGLTVDNEAVLTVGAGKIRIKNLVCDVVDMDIGAGELDVNDAAVAKEANIDLGMGSANIGGIITGDLNVDCSMGEVTLDMDDAEQNHNYEIDCSMGTVKVGRNSYSGMGSERTVNNGSNSDFVIDCSMGTVTVKFAD